MNSSMPVSNVSFRVVTGAQASSIAQASGQFAFERGDWVDAVAQARRRPHDLVVVQALQEGDVVAQLMGGTHRRHGVRVFESMPMGGYGGWRGADAMDARTEAALTRRFLRRAPWPVVVLTQPPRQDTAADTGHAQGHGDRE